ncbi:MULTISPECIES: hypothetical protein [Flavobacteriaceae]|nr:MULTISPECIES: hypothetical protein [Flavobacteriaceae]NJB38125.1 hypothetical protein [Croceivirga sp. JEA036]
MKIRILTVLMFLAVVSVACEKEDLTEYDNQTEQQSIRKDEWKERDT